MRRQLATLGISLALMAALPMTAATATPPAAHRVIVALWGDDTNPGTTTRPFRTIERAQREARTGRPLVIDLRGGTYRLSATLKPASSATYEAFGYGTPRQEEVVLSGGRVITGWTETPSGIWEAPAGGIQTRQLYVDGRRAPRAPLGAGLPGEVTATDTGYVLASPVPAGWSRPADIEFAYTFPFWVDARCGVDSIRRAHGKTVITMDQPCWSLARKLYGADGEPLPAPTAIDNSPSFLTKPGAWYLDSRRDKLLYHPLPGEDVRKAEVVAPVLQTLVEGDAHTHDVAFRGLTFADATWLAPSEPAGFVSAWSNYQRPGVDGWLTVPGNVAFRGSRRIMLSGNTFRRLGGQALELSRGVRDAVVEANLFTDVSDGGVVLGAVLPDRTGISRNVVLRRNRVHRTGVEYRGASGIWLVTGDDTTIEHNQVDNVPYTGILVGPPGEDGGSSHRTRILANRVFATNQVIEDGGGIYLRGKQGDGYADGALVRGNVVTDAGTHNFDLGIYTDDTSEYVTVDRNVVHGYPGSIGGCANPYLRDLRFRGNFWDDHVPEGIARRAYPGTWPTAAADDCGDPQHLTFEHNRLLSPDRPALECARIPACARIAAAAGPI
ncbi:right-handed parallel beta-helix repeat-containing protein [Kribbella monticola]|uniref:right-handed parallel beta-helix repeat-containing protein n=1 Tax=Kribbella monticola TaxID=2185285 RepID=UPI0018E58922|nr:right-handed parallel beta-helix repeat-containing protein [Kribbella monticola]